MGYNDFILWDFSVLQGRNSVNGRDL